MYSIEEINALSDAFETNNYEKSRDFWYVLDRLPIEHVILWSERLTKTKYLSNVNPNAWLDLIDMIRIAKDPKNFILSDKQKRFMVLEILTFWNDLSCDYVL